MLLLMQFVFMLEEFGLSCTQMVGVAKCCRFHGHCRFFFFFNFWSRSCLQFIAQNSPEVISDILGSHFCKFQWDLQRQFPLCCVRLDQILQLQYLGRWFFSLVGETAFHRAISGFGATCVTHFQLPASRLSCWCHLMEESAVSDWKIPRRPTSILLHPWSLAWSSPLKSYTR